MARMHCVFCTRHSTQAHQVLKCWFGFFTSSSSVLCNFHLDFLGFGQNDSVSWAVV